MKNIEAEKFTRIWIMLENVPRLPKKITVKELIEKLPDELKASPRTVQRDLEHLSKYGKWQLTSEKKGRTNYWSFTENSRLMAIPNMDIQTALAFKLVNKFSAKMLPGTVMKNIENHFVMAEETLLLKDPTLTNWTDKVFVIPNTPLLPPQIAPDVIEKVYDALLKGKMIKVNHYQKGKDEPYSFEANPLGIVFRDYTVYLICTTSYDDFKKNEYKPIHRMKDVEIMEKDSEVPKKFNLEDYVRQELSWKLSDEILGFKAEFDKWIAFMLYETPLSDSQTITELKNGNIRVEAKIPDTFQLRWWLLNLGEGVKVIKPERLKNEFKEIANNLSEIYKLKIGI